MAADTVVAVQPDLESFVAAQFDGIPGITVFTVAVVTDWPQWQRRHTIQVDARHKGGKQQAWQRGERARQLVCLLPDAEWADGVITYVQPVLGPSWLPDQDGCPRYTAQYEIRTHPRSNIPAERTAP